MLLGTGLTLRLEPLGQTTEYCPVCRCARSFALFEATLHRTLFFLPGERWGKAHHELRCSTCGCLLEHDVEERPLDEYGKPTQLPIIAQRIDDCSAMERARRDGALSDKHREEMIRSAFYAFARLFDEEPMQRVAPVALLGVSVISGLLIAGGVWAWIALGHGWLLVGLIALVLALLGGLYWWARSHNPRRYARQWIARTLAPLDPGEGELRKIKRELMTHRYKAGFLAKPEAMRQRIAALRADENWHEPTDDAGEGGGGMYATGSTTPVEPKGFTQE